MNFGYENDAPASSWLRSEGSRDEVADVLRSVTDMDSSNPGDIYSAAESLLHGREADARTDGRTLMWVAASMGHRRACMRLAEEMERAIRDDALDISEKTRVMNLAAAWRHRARTKTVGRIDMTVLRGSSDREPDDRPPFPGATVDAFATVPEDVRYAKVVVRRIGDASSPDAAAIKARYGSVVGRALPVAGSLPRTGMVSAAIEARWPWAKDVGGRIEGRLALLRSAGVQGARLKPLLFVGPPGGGKTRLAREMARMMGLPVLLIPSASSSDGGTLSAVTRDWRNTRPCGPVIAAIEGQCSNPAIIIDELDKAAPLGNQNGSVIGTLLGMIGSPDRYYDACLMSEVDLSWVSFIATANNLAKVPDSVCDRFDVIRIDRPGRRHFDTIIETMRRDEAEALGQPVEFLPRLDELEMRLLRNSFIEGASLRMIDRAHHFLLGQAALREAEAFGKAASVIH